MLEIRYLNHKNFVACIQASCSVDFLAFKTTPGDDISKKKRKLANFASVNSRRTEFLIMNPWNYQTQPDRAQCVTPMWEKTEVQWV